MKNKNLIIAGLSVLSLTAFFACSELPDHKESVNTGSLDFSRYMAIGNSITAGFQSGSLYEEAQYSAYSVLIAKQAGASDFQFPNLAGEGTGERITWDGTFTATGSPKLVTLPAATSAEVSARATNKTLARPYNNMGIPGAILVIPGTGPLGYVTDFFGVAVNATGTDAVVGPGGVAGSRNNPLFLVTLRSPSATLWSSMKAYKPTFVSFWLGNNDVLGYATGGMSPSAPTDATVFETKYQQIMDSLATLPGSPKVVVATIPDVTTIPFFTTVNVSLVGKVSKIYYQHSNGSVDSLETTAAALAAGTIYNKGMITLRGASQIGNGVTTFTGLAKAVPLGNAYVLDPAEIVIAKTALGTYNAKIKTIAAAKGWAVADVNAEFNAIAATGTTGKMFQGKKVTAAFITGGLFSYDGVHPSNLGQAIIANFMIKSMNAKFGSAIREVDLNTIKGLKFGKESTRDVTEMDLRGLNSELFNSTIQAVGGSVE